MTFFAKVTIFCQILSHCQLPSTVNNLGKFSQPLFCLLRFCDQQILFYGLKKISLFRFGGIERERKKEKRNWMSRLKRFVVVSRFDVPNFLPLLFFFLLLLLISVTRWLDYFSKFGH